MISGATTIINCLGLHARAAAKLVKLASQFDCLIMLGRDGREVNAKSIMGVMMLAAARGTSVTITADGADEATAIAAVKALIDDKFGEGE